MLHVQITPAESGPKLSVRIVGEIVENAQLEVLNLDGRIELHINARGIEYINSAGICVWVEWIAALKAKYPGVTIFLDEVPYPILKQIATVDNFLPEGSAIGSFYAPYTCEDCYATEEKLYEIGKDYPPNPSPTEAAALFETGIGCKCGSSLEVDALPSIFVKALLKYSGKNPVKTAV